jgi:hypothetical protein
VHLALVGVGVSAGIEKASPMFRFGLEATWRGAKAGLYGAYLSMEGTLGAAEGVFLRGGMPEAALAARASVGRRGWARAMCLLVGHNGWMASPASHHNESATEGVRADRVGAKPLL